MRRENPIVAIGDAPSRQVAVVYLLTALGIVLRPVQMYSEKVPFERFTQPISQFRLNQPQPGIVIVAEIPWFIDSRKIHGHVSADSELNTDIGCENSPVEAIGFYGKMLSFSGMKKAAKKCDYKQYFSHIPQVCLNIFSKTIRDCMIAAWICVENADQIGGKFTVIIAL